MNIFTFILTGILSWLLINPGINQVNYENSQVKSLDTTVEANQKFLEIYMKCGLKGKLSYKIFNKAMVGFNSFKPANNKILSIINFSKPSTEKRLFVIDTANKNLLFQTFVAHGKNSGMNIPTKFSNRIGSLQSSLGFFRTAETYFGKHGYSLMLDGLEKGINDNARRRVIVMHGAKYVGKSFIEKYNRLGRSWGCPAVSEKLSKEIIDKIKGGSYLFIYSAYNDYREKSIALNSNISPDVRQN